MPSFGSLAALPLVVLLVTAWSSTTTIYLADAATSPPPPPPEDDTIMIEDFEHPVHTWKEMNDPVMGGRSTGTFSIQSNLGIFEGEVVDVPFLHAPGFIQARTVDHRQHFPDISSCNAMLLRLKSKYPHYKGYRVSFGNAHAPGGKMFAYGYKANLPAILGDDEDEFVSIKIPFTNFTDYWDDATGDAIHTCQENHNYCPDTKTLRNMKTMAVWGEGVEGKVSLEIQSIAATGCGSASSSKQQDNSNSSKNKGKDEATTTKSRSSRTQQQQQQQRMTMHFLRGFSNQISLATLFLDRWFW